MQYNTQYLNIHKKVTIREWDNLNEKVRNIISNDTEGKSYALRSFEKYVEVEASRLYYDYFYK